MRNRLSMVGLAVLFLVAALFVPTVHAKSPSGNRVLVLFDKLNDKPLYSKFWESLEGRKYTLTFKTATDSDLAITVYDERLYDHIIMFSPRVKSFGGTVTPVTLVDFMKKGGNILLAANPTASETIRDFGREFDVEFDDRETTVIDHFSYNVDGDQSDHTVIVADQFGDHAGFIISEGVRAAPILFRGIAHRAGSVPLLTKVLSGGSTVYSAETAAGEPLDDVFVAGKEVGLVSAFQARNNARAVFAGSLDLFSDKFFDAKVRKYGENEKTYDRSGNEAFVADLTKWAFQEKGVLKVVSARHHKTGENEQKSWYRIKDNITYTLEVSEYKDDHWVPYNASDIQLEITMLDPHIRTYLHQVPISVSGHHSRFAAKVQLPDVYGVFTFKVDYKRPGLSYLGERHEVAIQPFRHNEYPRYLTAAYPYYAGMSSMIVGFLVFSAVWLGTWGNIKEAKKEEAKKKKKN